MRHSHAKSAISGLIIATWLLLCGAAHAGLTVQWSTCALSIIGTSVQGAASYSFQRSIWVYDSCHHVWIPTGAMELLSVRTEASCEVQLPVAISGALQMVARDASGLVLDTQTYGGAGTTFAANGPQPLDPTLRVVRGYVGESVVIQTSDVPSGVAVTWFRDGIEVPGVTGSSFTVKVHPGMHGVRYVPVATNECGQTIGGAREIFVNPLPASGILDWSLIRTRKSGQQPGYYCNSPCGYSVPVPDVVSDYPSPNIEAGPQGFAGSVTSSGAGTHGEGTLRLSFATTVPTRAVFSGSNSIGTIQCAPQPAPPCGGLAAHATLTGALSFDFPLTSAWGPVEIDLPIGEYTVTLRATGGSLPCSCLYVLQCGHSSASISANFFEACPGDLNTDGVVSAPDLIVLFNAWGRTGAGSEDLDHDGFVSTGDLSVLLGSWGCSP